MAEEQEKKELEKIALSTLGMPSLIRTGLAGSYYDLPDRSLLRAIDKIFGINMERRNDDMAVKKEVKNPVKEELKKVVPHIDNVFRGGQRVVIPEGMTTEDAIKLLDEVQEAEDYGDDTEDISDVIKVFPWDGALALSEALKEIFGASMQKKSMFGNAQQISVETGRNKSILVPWGRFNLPGTDGATISTGSTEQDGQFVFSLYVSDVPRKQQEKVRKLIARTREISSKNSIYKGKAIEMKFKDEKGVKLSIPSIKFMDTEGPSPIFRRYLEEAIDDYVLTPIYYPETLLAIGEKLKRGILLAGHYGTGKTLLATKIAREAVKFGWTFIYVKDTTEFTYAFNFARQQQPAVVFGEDVDRLAILQRTEPVQELLNTLDSIDTKHEKIITLFTTNHPDNIHPAMHRPGRIDITLKVEAPDAEAVTRLIYQYANGLLEKGTDLSAVSKKLENQIPAVIHEVVKRSKYVAVRRLKGSPNISINGNDLSRAAEILLKEKGNSKTEEMPMHPALAIGELIGMGIGRGLSLEDLNGKDKPVAFLSPHPGR